jgi:hypothetical protein
VRSATATTLRIGVAPNTKQITAIRRRALGIKIASPGLRLWPLHRVEESRSRHGHHRLPRVGPIGEVGLQKPRPRPARLTIFGPRTASVSRRNLHGMGLTETLTLLILCEDCCAGMVPHGGASLRCRRHGWLYSGDEGSRGPGTRCAGWEHRVRDQRRHGRDARRGALRPRRDRYFGAEGAAILDTWLPPTCKEGSVQGRDKGCRV